ncbi:MAG: 2-hydroxyacyl-CoA dehydratase [Ignavibacteriales bacterium]|nr:2-hydroxyacyl-CoA dehydratase [Ignavibacteriales bacterium]
MTFEEKIEHYRTIIDDVSYPTVNKWKEEHPNKKVVGMFPVYTPYELPHAAGMLPVGVFGAGGKIEIDHADSRIQSFVCSIARSTLELGLTERLKNFDALYFTSICDVARNLSGIWQTNFPQQLVEYIHFPQNMNNSSAPKHYRAELQKLVSNLEQLSGKKITNEDLLNSIKTFNRNRELCLQLYHIKSTTPHLLSTFEAYIVLRLGTLLPVEEHSQLLEGIIPQIHQRKRTARDFVRVMIEGSFCEQPPLELMQVIEDAGCYIVDDDLLLHSRWFNEAVPLNGDPLLSLAESYINRSRYSSVRHYGNKSRKEQFLEKIKSGKVDGVLFCAPKFCEPALLDYVVLKDELEKHNISYMTFEYEEKMGVFESIRMQVETFVESVLFFS